MHTKQIDGTDITTWVLPEGATARLGRGRVMGMAFPPDGASLAVATTIGCWWYNLPTMTPRALWETERGMVSAISFSHDARWIATSNWDGIVKVWDTQNLQCIAKIEVPRNPEGKTKRISRLIFSPDSQHLAAAGSHRSTVYTWHTNTDIPIARFTIDETEKAASVVAFPIAFSPDGCLLAYKSDYHVTSVLDVESGENIAEFPDEYTAPLGYYEFTFSPCGQYLAVCNRKDTVHVWNVHKGTLEMAPTVYGSGSIQVLPAYTPDGTLRVAGLYQNEVVIWDAAEKEKVDTFEYMGQYRTAACFSADGTRFAAINRCGELHVWTEGPPSTVVSLPGHLHTADSVVFSKGGGTLVSGHRGRTGNLFWNVAQRRVERIFPSLADHDLPYSSALSPCEKLLATSGRRGTSKVGTIKIWALASGAEVAELTEHQKQVYALAFSPMGEYLISVCGKSVIVWDALRWKKRHSLIGHIDTIGAVVAFHPCGKHLVTASPDGLAFLWDVKRGEQLFSLPTTTRLDFSLYKGTPQAIQQVIEQQEPAHRCIKAIAFSPCGSLIAGGMQDEIRIWDASTSETRMAILPPQSCQKQYALAFSPCGGYLASGAWWQAGQKKVSVRLWEVASGENVATFWGHPTDVQDLAFSPDGALLASGGFDGTILLWDMEPLIGS